MKPTHNEDYRIALTQHINFVYFCLTLVSLTDVYYKHRVTTGFILESLLENTLILVEGFDGNRVNK